MNGLRRLWGGELPLAVAFWDWAVLGGLVVNLPLIFAMALLLSEGQALAALLVGYAAPLPYNVAALVGVWRCAARYPGPPAWAHAARIGALLWLGFLTAI